MATSQPPEEPKSPIDRVFPSDQFDSRPLADPFYPPLRHSGSGMSEAARRRLGLRHQAAIAVGSVLDSLIPDCLTPLSDEYGEPLGDYVEFEEVPLPIDPHQI